MSKKAVAVVSLLFIFTLLTAMGGKGGGFERAPRVNKNFSVEVTDASGNSINGEKFSWEGRTRFSGYMGLAEVNLPFDKIKDVTVGAKKAKKVRITAHLADNSEVSLDVDADSRCFGEAGFGSFMLTMEEIKAIHFMGMKEVAPETRH